MIPSLDIAGWQLSTYNLILALYLPFAVLTTLHVARRQRIDPGAILKLAMVAVPAGIVGARLLDVLEYPTAYTGLADLVGRHGSSIYGAFLGMGAVVVAGARRLGISPLRVMDAGAPAMALGEATTRIGCFLNGCCYGRPFDGVLTVTFPPQSFAYADQLARGMLPAGAAGSLAVHPVQLYSSAIMVCVFGLLWRRTRTRGRVGYPTSIFLVSYGVLRLGMAPFRAEALLSMKAFSIVFIAAGLIGLWWARQERSMPIPSRARQTVLS